MIRIIAICLAILVIPFGLCAETSKLAVGLGFPCFLIKYQPVELRYANGKGISVWAARAYWNFYDNDKVKGFAGVEGGYIQFDTLDMKGNGYEGSVFIGGEYRFVKNMGLAIDLAPTLIQLKSNDDYKTKGFEMVTNIAIYYYFSGRAKE